MVPVIIFHILKMQKKIKHVKQRQKNKRPKSNFQKWKLQMSDIKNMPYGNNSRLDTTEENITDLEEFSS